MRRSAVHLITVFAARLEQRRGSGDAAVTVLKELAEEEADRRAESSDHDDQEASRIARQRATFAGVGKSSPKKRRAAMLQRAYDLIWDGDGTGCDALAEFLPEADVEEMFDAWDHDQQGQMPRSRFYGGKP